MRWREHKRDADKGRGYAFHQAIRKHGWDAFQFEVICCGTDKRAMLEHVEPALIEQHQSSIGKNGYNMHKKVLGCLTDKVRPPRKPCTEETRTKLRQAGMGRVFSPVTREKIRQTQLGKIHSEETKSKISIAKQNPSEETRKKISNSLQGKPGRHVVPHSDETKQRISEAKMGRSIVSKGQPKSEEHKQKLKEAWKRRRLKSAKSLISNIA
jgi:NUMOD3 motif